MLIERHDPDFAVEIIVLGGISDPLAIRGDRVTDLAKAIDQGDRFLGFEVHGNERSATLLEQKVLSIGGKSQVGFRAGRFGHACFDKLLLLPPVLRRIFGLEFPKIDLSVLTTRKPEGLAIVGKNWRFLVSIRAGGLDGLFEFGVHDPKISVDAHRDLEAIVAKSDLFGTACRGPKKVIRKVRIGRDTQGKFRGLLVLAGSQNVGIEEVPKDDGRAVARNRGFSDRIVVEAPDFTLTSGLIPGCESITPKVQSMLGTFCEVKGLSTRHPKRPQAFDFFVQ